MYNVVLYLMWDPIFQVKKYGNIDIFKYNVVLYLMWDPIFLNKKIWKYCYFHVQCGTVFNVRPYFSK